MLSFQDHSIDSSHRGLPKLAIPSTNHTVSSYSPHFNLFLGPPIDLQPSPRVSFSSCDYQSRDRDISPPQSFVSVRSRVLRVHNFRSLSPTLIANLLHQKQGVSPTPMTIWALKDAPGHEDDRVLYCVYRTHEEARQKLLSPSTSLFSLSAASERDLEPFTKLRRVDYKQSTFSSTSSSSGSPMSSNYTSSPSFLNPHPPPFEVNTIRQSSSFSDFRQRNQVSQAPRMSISPPLPLSTNPPNARSNFRPGDWLCTASLCGAHNFGRNMTCIGCGSQRPTTATGSARQTGQPQQKFPSPRFAGAGSTPGFDLQNHASERRFSLPDTPKSPTSSFPVLTPSGRQFSIGGKVQNVSRDPMAPCFMFWSFNEPFPQPGQIRPPLSSDVQFPPILNTGNHGPIEKQQGDWCCTGSGPENPCGFLNWRRRKVCQACYPYAEGNGDSVSKAVQAERIALLANVLERPSFNHSLPPSPSSPVSSSYHASGLSAPSVTGPGGMLPRSRSHADLVRFAEQPIYETSGAGFNSNPCPLLPSFLQDIVHSPALSPSSSTSAEFSIEEYDDIELPPPSFSRKPSSGFMAFNIWAPHGDETKAFDL